MTRTRTRFAIDGKDLEAPTEKVLDISKRLFNIAAIEDRRDRMVQRQRVKVKVKLMDRVYHMTTNELRATATSMNKAAKNVQKMARQQPASDARPLFEGGWITKLDVETVIRNSRPYARSIPAQTQANRQNATRLWNWLRRFLVAKHLVREYCTVCSEQLDRALVCRCGPHEAKGWSGTEGVRIDDFRAMMDDKSFVWPYRPGNIKDNLDELVDAVRQYVPAS